METLFQEKGIDPQGISESDDALTCELTLPDGTLGRVAFYDMDDGYFSAVCMNAIETTLPFNKILWPKACFTHDLMGTDLTADTRHFGCVALTIRPQSVDELRADLERFVTRISLAVESFRKATT